MSDNIIVNNPNRDNYSFRWIFVYDTMQEGQAHNWILQRADGIKIQNAQLHGYIKNVEGKYCSYIRKANSNAFVQGEIWSVRAEKISMIDFFKGVKVSKTRREDVRVNDGDHPVTSEIQILVQTWVSAV